MASIAVAALNTTMQNSRIVHVNSEFISQIYFTKDFDYL